MRPLLIALALIAAGCRGPYTTVRAAPAEPPPRAAELTAKGGGYRGTDYVLAPVYDQPRRVVFLACVRACDTYCHDKPTVADEAAGRIEVYDANAWTGSAHLAVMLEQVDDAHVRLEMTASPGGDLIGSGRTLCRDRMRGFIEQVTREVAAFRALGAPAP